MNLTSLFKISKKCNVPLIADSQTAVIKVIVLWGCTNFPSVLRIKAGLANASSRKLLELLCSVTDGTLRELRLWLYECRTVSEVSVLSCLMQTEVCNVSGTSFHKAFGLNRVTAVKGWAYNLRRVRLKDADIGWKHSIQNATSSPERLVAFFFVCQFITM